MKLAKSHRLFNFSSNHRGTAIGVKPMLGGLLLCALILLSAFSMSVQSQGSSVDASIISRDVLVADGDTMQTIARRELGRAGLAPHLAQFNGLVESAPLVTGNIIRIPIHVPPRGEFAEVVFIKGNVFAKRLIQVDTTAKASSTSIQLKRNNEVYAGDVISTGPNGYVSIEFSSGSIINLQPETEATLVKLNCLPNDDSCLIELRAAHGKLSSDVQTRDNQPVEFRISTPYASAAVRGTIFDIDVLGDTLIVGVTEGDVDFSAQEQTVDLGVGFGSLVKEGEAPLAPIALLPAPVFKLVPARVARGDSVSWWPFTDASEYTGLIAADEAGIEALARFSTSTDEMAFPTVDSGDYYLILRAIDANGLQGFTSNTRLTIADIDPDTPTVQTTISKQGREFLVSIIDPPIDAAGFEIQISTTEQFDDPLSVDVNSSGSAVFRLDNDRVFTRARVLLNPFTVSEFGSVADSGN